MLFCHKYSIVNLHIDVFKNWMTHYLFGKAFLAWLSGWPRLINIKTGSRRITRPYELSSVVLPSRRATKDYSSSRIMHLVPVAILEKKNRTNCFVCLFLCLLPQLQLISQSVWVICRCRQESRQRCLLECVTHISFDVDIMVKKKSNLVLLPTTISVITVVKICCGLAWLCLVSPQLLRWRIWLSIRVQTKIHHIRFG